jgi:hypothetical protein
MRTLAVLMFLALSSCVTVPPPVPVEPTDTAKCSDACAHLKALGCEEGEELPDGTSCTVFCEMTQQAGHALNPSCVMKIKVCREIDTCQVNRAGTR